MGPLSTCRKMRLTSYVKDIVKRIPSLDTIISRRQKRSYVLFTSNFVPSPYFRTLQFHAGEYLVDESLRESIDFANVRNYVWGKVSEIAGITLQKRYLKKITIDAKSLNVIYPEMFLWRGEQNLEAMINAFFDSANILKEHKNIIYKPENKKLFYDLDKVINTIKKYVVKSQENVEFSYFLSSIVLFFIERLYDYFLDLLESRHVVKIEIVSLGQHFSLKRGYFYEILPTRDFYEMWLDQSSSIIIEGKKRSISTDRIKKRLIKAYIEYLTKQTGSNVVIGENTKDWELLDTVAAHAFYVFLMSYISTILRLDKLYVDYREIEFLHMKIDIKDEMVCFEAEGNSFCIEKNILLEDSFLRQFLTGKQQLSTSESAFVFITEDNEVRNRPAIFRCHRRW